MGSRSDELVLTRAVADTADAWLHDPLDTSIYHRLVAAVVELRAYRAGRLAVRHIDDPEPQEQPQPDELFDGLADTRPAIALGELRAGDDPKQVLARIRELSEPPPPRTPESRT